MHQMLSEVPLTFDAGRAVCQGGRLYGPTTLYILCGHLLFGLTFVIHWLTLMPTHRQTLVTGKTYLDCKPFVTFCSSVHVL